MLGAVSPESFDTLHSYSNTFQMPFVTPWFPEEVSTVICSNTKENRSLYPKAREKEETKRQRSTVPISFAM